MLYESNESEHTHTRTHTRLILILKFSEVVSGATPQEFCFQKKRKFRLRGPSKRKISANTWQIPGQIFFFGSKNYPIDFFASATNSWIWIRGVFFRKKKMIWDNVPYKHHLTQVQSRKPINCRPDCTVKLIEMVAPSFYAVSYQNKNQSNTHTRTGSSDRWDGRRCWFCCHCTKTFIIR